MFSPVVDRDLVELKAKGQASAQSTTGTMTCGAHKKNEVTLIVAPFEKFESFENLRILRILRILRSLNIYLRILRILRVL